MNFKTKEMVFSPIKAIQEEAQKRGAISLAQGIPKFLPPQKVREAAVAAILSGKADFYGPPRGLEELRQQISQFHLNTEKAFYDPSHEILVTAGALQALSVALATLFSPGEELLVLTPSYFPFLNLPKIFGIRPVYVSLRAPDWRLDLTALKKAITPKTRAILLCHPNNPTGTIYSRQEISQILKIAAEHNLWVLVDEVYRFFTYGDAYTSLGDFSDYKDRLIRLMSFSKAFSLSGWRVGYLLGSSKVIKELIKVHEMMTTAAASLPAQYAALTSLADPSIAYNFGQILRARRQRMRKRLQKFSDYFTAPEPSGAYYFFVKLKKEGDDQAFSERLLKEAGVAVVPGSTFGEAGKGYLRLSFAATEGEIDEAFSRLEIYLLPQLTLIPLVKNA